MTTDTWVALFWLLSQGLLVYLSYKKGRLDERRDSEQSKLEQEVKSQEQAIEDSGLVPLLVWVKSDDAKRAN